MGALEPEIHEPVPVIASHEPEDPPTCPLSLENRFERILELVEEAGFDTLDGMAAAYYTTKFQPDSHARYAQSQSRTRYLRPLLQALNVSSTDWPRREVAGYKDGIARSAEGVYVEELAGFRQRQQQQQTRDAGSPASTESSEGTDTSSLGGRRAAALAEKFRHFFMVVDASRGVKEDRQVFRQQVSFSLVLYSLPSLPSLLGFAVVNERLDLSLKRNKINENPHPPALTGPPTMVPPHPTRPKRRTSPITRIPNRLRLSIHTRYAQMMIFFPHSFH